MVSSKNSIHVWCIQCIFFALISPVFLTTLRAEEPPSTAGIYSECQIDPTADSNFTLALFRLWLPDSAIPVKGVLAVLPGSEGDGIPMANDPAWQALAKGWNYALLGITFTTRSGAAPYFRAEFGSGDALLSALDQIAAESNHAELKSVPMAILGFSQGGQFAYQFTCRHPERVMAFATIKGGRHHGDSNEAANAIPGVLIAGEKDEEFRKENLRKIFALNQCPPGRWCFAMEPGVGHLEGRSLDLIIPFFNAVIYQQLQPMLGSPETLALAPLTSATTASHGVWLPNQEVADKWIGFMRGTLPATHQALIFIHEGPPKLSTNVYATLDFGDIKSDQKPKPQVVRIQPLPDGPNWDAVRAISRKSLLDVEVTQSGNEWLVSALPRTPVQQPLGRVHDSILLRFSQGGKHILVGSEINVTFRHVHDDVDLSPAFFYFGTHADVCQETVKLSARRGNLRVSKPELNGGTAASLDIIRESEKSATLQGTFRPLPEASSHSGEFSLWLEEPIKIELRIAFMGYYKPQSAPPP